MVLIQSIHVYGRIFYDVLSYGEKPHSGNVYSMVGGSGFNIALGLKKLGYEVYLHSAFGDDDLGEIVEKTLDKHALKKEYIECMKGQTGLFIANNDRPVSVRLGVNSVFSPKFEGQDFEKSICVVLATENSKETLENIFTKKWMKKIVDIGPNCKVDIEADLILGNENECIGRKCNIIKMGRRGAFFGDAYIEGNGLELPFTMGAGDVFDCAIIDSLLEGKGKHAMLESAVKMAEEACLIPGTSRKMSVFDNKRQRG